MPDLSAAIEQRLRGAGFRPVNVDLSDPEWKEAFLFQREAHRRGRPTRPNGEGLRHPRRPHGPGGRARPEHAPRWWRRIRARSRPWSAGEAAPHRVRTPNLPSALGFFSGLLQGTVTAEGDGHADLEWPGNARLRLELQPDATPGVDRLEVIGLTAPIELIGTRFVPADS